VPLALKPTIEARGQSPANIKIACPRALRACFYTAPVVSPMEVSKTYLLVSNFKVNRSLDRIPFSPKEVGVPKVP